MPQKKLDEAYFRAYVDPILHKKGKDGYACANCHVTHTLFNATWSTVMNVVDTCESGEQPDSAQADFFGGERRSGGIEATRARRRSAMAARVDRVRNHPALD